MLKDIHFFNARRLAEELKVGRFSEEHAFKHLLLSSILFSGQFYIPLIVSDGDEAGIPFWMQVVSYALTAVIQFWGMRMLYQTNQSGDGRHFFARWAALSLPVGVQVVVVIGLVGVALGVAFGQMAENLMENSLSWKWGLIEIIFGIGIQLFYFKLMRENLLTAASGTSGGIAAV